MSLNPAEKAEIIKLVEDSPATVRHTLRELGVSKSTFYNWYWRWTESGYAGLESHKRLPHKIWNRIPEEEKKLVIEAALQYPEKSCREIACWVTDRHRVYVSESSVYRILRGKGIIPEPVYAVNTAKDKFESPTVRTNQLWQTDFTYLKVTGWGWYYLLTVLDDFSRYILAWRLCTGMDAGEVKATLKLAIDRTGIKGVPVRYRPGLLTDNGSAFISGALKDYLQQNDLWITHGRPMHPQTQGKIERYHRSMKNILLLDNYYLPGELECRIGEWVKYYNERRYHEGIGNVTPADKYQGRAEKVLELREYIRRETIRRRLTAYRNDVLTSV